MSLYPSRHVCDHCGKLHIGGWNANSICVCADNPYAAPEPILDLKPKRLGNGRHRVAA